jgi:hypothetical protein
VTVRPIHERWSAAISDLEKDILPAAMLRLDRRDIALGITRYPKPVLEEQHGEQHT